MVNFAKKIPEDPAVNAPVNWVELVDSDVVSKLTYSFAKRHNLVALCEHEGSIEIICTKTPEMEIYAELKRKLNRPLRINIISQAGFEQVLRIAYDKGQTEATQMIDDMDGEIDLDLLAGEVPEATDLLAASDDAPVVKLINALLTQAIRENASDIHLEVFEKRSLVRFRVDGILRDIVEPQRALHSALISRLKVMANLDIAEKRLPQDGRISLMVGERPIDVRVSSLPTQYGERIVLRLLDKQGARLDLSGLGMPDDTLEIFNQLIHTPHGILLVTGPTGSGKTTTLYAGLSKLDRNRNNILTIEDPVEYDLDGIGQIQVNSRIGLTFASGLRSILRQDPDIVLVGEIRDLDTAEIAIQSSLTGHLVMSTLHTNTAIGAVTRLIDMGVEDFLIASSLIGIMSQRLVRVLCAKCKTPIESDTALQGLTLNFDPVETTVYQSSGCDACEFTGYSGRHGIYELIQIDNPLRTLIHDQKSETEMLKHIRNTTPSLLDNGIKAVLQGITSVDEVVRVTRSE